MAEGTVGQDESIRRVDLVFAFPEPHHTCSSLASSLVLSLKLPLDLRLLISPPISILGIDLPLEGSLAVPLNSTFTAAHEVVV